LNTLFKQDDATSYIARISIDLLRLAFPGRLISRNGDILFTKQRPVRSSELTASDFFLRGYLKAKVFKNNPPRTTVDLKERNHLEINSIPLEHFATSWEASLSDNQGKYFTDTIFKK